MSHYTASKAALSSYVESLHKEVSPLGIKCVAFECGGFPTHLGQARPDTTTTTTTTTTTPGSDGEPFAGQGPGIKDYEPGMTALSGLFATDPMSMMPGDLSKVAPRMVDVVKREGTLLADRPWSVRVALGSDSFDFVTGKCKAVLASTEAWKDVSYSTDRDDVAAPGANKTLLEYVLSP